MPASGSASLEAVFAPVRSQTAFEETVERLGSAIRIGLLPPGARLPAERELCAQLGIARSTLRHALTALAQSGHLRAVRGRGGGTFVTDAPPPPAAPSAAALATMQEACDARLATELGVVVLASERATAQQLAALDALVIAMDAAVEEFAAYRVLDVRFHVALAEAAASARLIAATTEAQAAMGDLIVLIAHPPEVLAWSNAQHARIVAAVARGDAGDAVGVTTEHLVGTQHVLAGLLP